MKKPTLSELSDAELLKTEKTLKILSVLFTLAVFILVILSVYLFRRDGFSVFTLLPIFMLPLFIVNLLNLNFIKIEKKKRNFLD